jgi:hypothetical protein
MLAPESCVIGTGSAAFNETPLADACIWLPAWELNCVDSTDFPRLNLAEKPLRR